MLDGTHECVRDICEACHLLYSSGLICSSGGNVSLKKEDTVYITRTGSTFSQMSAMDIVKVALETGATIGDGFPSKELGFHLALHRAHPGVRAVVHVHPTKLIAYTARHAEPGLNRIKATNAGFYVRSGQIPLLPYLPSGSEALHQAVEELASDFTTIALANHGIIVARETLLEAMNAAEEIEQNCDIYLTAGEDATYLTKEQQQDIDAKLSRAWPEPEKYAHFFERL